MSAAIIDEPVSVEFVDLEAALGWLLPWMTRVEGVEPGGFRATFGITGSPGVQGHEFTLAAVHLSGRLLRQFFDDSPISVAVFEPAGRLVQVNGAFCAMLGCAAEELIERNIEELLHPDDVPSVQEQRRRLVEGKCNEFQVETRFAPAHRPEVWTRMCGRLERYGGDRPPHVFAHIVEFTELKSMQENVRRTAAEINVKNWDPERYM